jgi:hypothetical protein
MRKHKDLSNYLDSLGVDSRELRLRNSYLAVGSAAVGADQFGEEIQIFDKSLQSQNYVTGSSGWRIDGSGDAEFENVFVRGDINAQTGTIGYWNISRPIVQRTFGSTTLFGTFLESYNHGADDLSTITGNYVSLFKSYEDISSAFSGFSVTSNFVTITCVGHSFSVGSQIVVSFENAAYASYETTETPPTTIVSTTEDTFTYSIGTINQTGAADVAFTDAAGEAYIYVEDVAGLYLRDYGKVDFDYGYFSNKGVQFNSPYEVNFVKNPSFEFINNDANDPVEPIISEVSWQFPAASLADENTIIDVTAASSGALGVVGVVSWSTSAITSQYLYGTLDYNALYHFRALISNKTLYLNFTLVGGLPSSYDLSDIKFEFSDGSTVNIYDVLTDECQAEWDLTSGKSWILVGQYYYTTTRRQNPGLPRISGGKLLAAYESLDPEGLALGEDILIRFPVVLYNQANQNYSTFVKSSPTVGSPNSLMSMYIDSVQLSTVERFFFGSIPYSSNHGWWVSGELDEIRDIDSPAYASVETSSKWIDLDLDNQLFNLKKVDLLEFDSRALKTMYSEPAIYSSSGDVGSIIYGEVADPLTFTRLTSGTYTNYRSSIYISDSNVITDYVTGEYGGGFKTRSKYIDYSYGGSLSTRFESGVYGISDPDTMIAGIYSEKQFSGGVFHTAKITAGMDVYNVTSITTESQIFQINTDDGTSSNQYNTSFKVSNYQAEFFAPIRFKGTVNEANLTSADHALQIGASTGTHMKFDGEEIQAVSSSNTAATLSLNPAGGGITLGNATSVLTVSGSIYYDYGYNNAVTGRDLYVSSAGLVGYLSSSRTVKREIQSAGIDVDSVLSIVPKTFKYVPGHLASGNEDEAHIGFIAEDLADAGLELFVDYNENTGQIQGIKYNRYVVALQAVARDQQSKIDSLESRVSALGG